MATEILNISCPESVAFPLRIYARATYTEIVILGISPNMSSFNPVLIKNNQINLLFVGFKGGHLN